MNEELERLFVIQCKKCNSYDVSIFCSGYGGEITVSCNEEGCDNEKEI